MFNKIAVNFNSNPVNPNPVNPNSVNHNSVCPYPVNTNPVNLTLLGVLRINVKRSFVQAMYCCASQINNDSLELFSIFCNNSINEHIVFRVIILWLFIEDDFVKHLVVLPLVMYNIRFF